MPRRGSPGPVELHAGQGGDPVDEGADVAGLVGGTVDLGLAAGVRRSPAGSQVSTL